jgi:putative tryptophan/tyrosine transport system substrate-binding protein
MKRREFIALLGGIAAWPLAARAQQSTSVARIGFLNTTDASASASYIGAFRTGLRDLGHVEGKNFVIESRFAEGNVDRLPDLAAELVRVNVDVIVTSGPGVHAAQDATSTIPIVMLVIGDAVTSELSPASDIPAATLPDRASSIRNSWRNASSC